MPFPAIPWEVGTVQLDFCTLEKKRKTKKKQKKAKPILKEIFMGFIPWNCSFDLKFPEECAGGVGVFLCFSIFSTFSKSLIYKKGFFPCFLHGIIQCWSVSGAF